MERGIQEDNSKVFKVSFFNQLYALEYLLTVNLLLVVALYVLHLRLDDVVIVLIVLYALPVLYLHIEYYLTDRGKVIEIHDGLIKVHFSKDSVKDFQTSDIIRIIINKSKNYATMRFPITAFEKYYYVKMIFADGESVIITSLMIRNLEKVIIGIRGVDIFRLR